MSFTLEVILTAFYFFLFAACILRCSFFKSTGLPKYFLLSVFTLKFIAGIILTLIYTYYYSNRLEADIFKYFDDSKVMFNALNEKPEDFFRMIGGMYGGNDYYYMHTYYYEMNNWYREFEGETFNDSHTIIRFNAVARIFSFGVFHVHTLFVCFLSLTGITALYKSFSSFFKGKEVMMACSLFLLPSIVFWGSGVLKEGLLLFALGLLFYSAIQTSENVRKVRFLILFSFCFFILIYLKIYALLLMLPFLIAFITVKKTNYQKPWIIHLTVFILAAVTALNIHHILPDWNILEMITHKQHDFINHSIELNSQSRIEMDYLEPNFLSFLMNSPVALFNTLVRPFIFESSNPMMILAGLENLFLIGIIVLALIKRDTLNSGQKNLLLFLLSFSLLMFVLVGMATPVMGAIVRYKVPSLGMLAAAFIMIGDWKTILNNFPKLKKLLYLE